MHGLSRDLRVAQGAAPPHLCLITCLVPAVHVDQDAQWNPVPEVGGNPRAVRGDRGYLTSQLEPVREPWGDPTDVAAGDGYPASWLGFRADPQAGRMDVARRRAFPAPWLNPGLNPSWYPRETNRKTVQKEAFQKGSRHTVPVSDEEGEAMQETGMPGSSPGAHSCTSCQQPNLEALVQRRRCQRSQEWLSEDDCHLWCVEVIASSVPERCS
ncbi:uncharacterized protein ACIBXB_005730 [Morphnus guianensis]